MAQLEEEDLARFRFDELMDVVEEVAVSLERSGDPKEQAQKLRKVSEELRKRDPEKAQNPVASAAPGTAQVRFASRAVDRGVPSRTKNLKPPGRRG